MPTRCVKVMKKNNATTSPIILFKIENVERPCKEICRYMLDLDGTGHRKFLL